MNASPSPTTAASSVASWLSRTVRHSNRVLFGRRLVSNNNNNNNNNNNRAGGWSDDAVGNARDESSKRIFDGGHRTPLGQAYHHRGSFTPSGQLEVEAAVPVPAVDERGAPSSSTSSSSVLRRSRYDDEEDGGNDDDAAYHHHMVLQERLQEVLILELHRNGNREFRDMTLRDLYSYVMTVVTSRPATARRRGSRPRALPSSSSSSSSSSTATPPPLLPSRSLRSAASTTRSVVSEENDGGAFEAVVAAPERPSRSRSRRRPRDRAAAAAEPTYRERLGGYLHPRDMRRLVTPFSASNEPELIVRRHAVLLNFDHLRAVVLRDRALVFVPDGADSLLGQLEKRLRGGARGLEEQVFGTADYRRFHQHESNGVGAPPSTSSSSDDRTAPTVVGSSSAVASDEEDDDEEEEHHDDEHDDRSVSRRHARRHHRRELRDISDRRWIYDVPFELVAVDAVLQSVHASLARDFARLRRAAAETMGALRGDDRRGGLDLGSWTRGAVCSQETLRLRKDEVALLEGRVQGLVRALTQILDDDEDMALMNLSRLVTHPERFIQPVPDEILNEESDEPELILEALLQQALSIVNGLDLLKGRIVSTEESVLMNLDTVRNRLLLVNTSLTSLSVVLSCGSLVGSIFGMNLVNGYETDPRMFGRVVWATTLACAMLVTLFAVAFRAAASAPS